MRRAGPRGEGSHEPTRGNRASIARNGGFLGRLADGLEPGTLSPAGRLWPGLHGTARRARGEDPGISPAGFQDFPGICARCVVVHPRAVHPGQARRVDDFPGRRRLHEARRPLAAARRAGQPHRARGAAGHRRGVRESRRLPGAPRRQAHQQQPVRRVRHAESCLRDTSLE